jgi:hypothetical protein
MFSIAKLSMTQKDAIRGAAIFDDRGPRSMTILAALPTKRALVRFRLAEARQPGAAVVHYLTEDGLKAAFQMLADREARLARAHVEALTEDADRTERARVSTVTCGFCGKRDVPMVDSGHACFTVVEIATGIVGLAKQVPASKMSWRSSRGLRCADDILTGKTMPQDVPAERLLALADLGKLLGGLVAGSTLEDDHEVALTMHAKRTPSGLTEACEMADQIIRLAHAGQHTMSAVNVACAVTLASAIKLGCFTGVSKTGLDTLEAYLAELTGAAANLGPAAPVDPREEMAQRLSNFGLRGWMPPNGTAVEERFYINNWAALVGFETETYRTGNISSATLGGEAISNRAAKDLIGARYWVKVAADGTLTLDYSGTREARNLLPKVEAKLRALFA